MTSSTTVDAQTKQRKDTGRETVCTTFTGSFWATMAYSSIINCGADLSMASYRTEMLLLASIINSRSSIRCFDLIATSKFLKIFQVENKGLQFHRGWNLCVSPSAAHPFQFRFFRCLVIYRKRHTWKNNKCEPNTEPCLVVCAVNSTSVRISVMGSAKLKMVPKRTTKMSYHLSSFSTIALTLQKNIEWVIAEIVSKKFLFEVVCQLSKRGPCVTENITLKRVGSVLKLKMPQKSHNRL